MSTTVNICNTSNIRLLIFACPKPFVEPFTLIQQNAINSWKALKKPKRISIDIYLIGDEEGVSEHAAQLDCKHISDIQKNKFGTPLVDCIFKKIKSVATECQSQHPEDTVVCCYINADIIVFEQFITNIEQFLKKRNEFKNDCSYADINKYLLVGMRWDCDNIPKIDFNDKESVNNVIQYAKENGESHGCWGIDYFIFSPKTFGFIYPFAIGKFVWDRWLVGNIFRQDSVTVDITQTNFVIHQNGDWYQSSTGGITNNRKALFDTEEVKINYSFDYYEKDVVTGTQWETILTPANEIQYKFKEHIPRSD